MHAVYGMVCDVKTEKSKNTKAKEREGEEIETESRGHTARKGACYVRERL